MHGPTPMDGWLSHSLAVEVDRIESGYCVLAAAGRHELRSLSVSCSFSGTSPELQRSLRCSVGQSIDLLIVSARAGQTLGHRLGDHPDGGDASATLGAAAKSSTAVGETTLGR